MKVSVNEKVAYNRTGFENVDFPITLEATPLKMGKGFLLVNPEELTRATGNFHCEAIELWSDEYKVIIETKENDDRHNDLEWLFWCNKNKKRTSL